MERETQTGSSLRPAARLAAPWRLLSNLDAMLIQASRALAADMDLLERRLAPRIGEAPADTPVVLLNGPRVRPAQP